MSRWRFKLGNIYRRDRPLAETSYWSSEAGEATGITYNSAVRFTSSVKRNDRGVPMSEPQAGDRFLLWIDAVGGYLVCLEDSVVLGQAAPGNHVDVPIFGDISRRHAVIQRHASEYVIEPIQAVSVEGHKTCDTTLLSDGDEICLGESVKLRFRKPHGLSASARLDFISRHRTQPSADGVLLMAESCVLGPRWKNHVVCPDWESDVVVFRQGAEMFCRTSQDIEVDGKICAGRGKISRNSRISGTDFSLSLEEI